MLHLDFNVSDIMFLISLISIPLEAHSPSFYEFLREAEKSFFCLIKQKAEEKKCLLEVGEKKIKISSSEVCLRELKSC